jgi:hypothetical protein
VSNVAAWHHVPITVRATAGHLSDPDRPAAVDDQRSDVFVDSPVSTLDIQPGVLLSIENGMSHQNVAAPAHLANNRCQADSGRRMIHHVGWYGVWFLAGLAIE